jgi:hypothetical protein
VGSGSREGGGAARAGGAAQGVHKAEGACVVSVGGDSFLMSEACPGEGSERREEGDLGIWGALRVWPAMPGVARAKGGGVAKGRFMRADGGVPRRYKALCGGDGGREPGGP